MNHLLGVFLYALTLAATWAWVVAHQLAIFYAFNFFVDQLPEPVSNPVYKYIYIVLHAVAANWKSRVVPATKTKP